MNIGLCKRADLAIIAPFRPPWESENRETLARLSAILRHAP
jgi:hypothetical protein